MASSDGNPKRDEEEEEPSWKDTTGTEGRNRSFNTGRVAPAPTGTH